MISRLVGYGILAALLITQSAYGQGRSCPCDYFSTAGNVEQTKYLKLVEDYHVTPVPSSIREGRLNAALADLNYTLERFPNHPRALQFVSVVAQLRKQPGVAFPYFEKAVNLFPQHALTHSQYGLFLVSVGEIDKGLQVLERSIEIDPKLSAGYAALAHAYAKKGDLPRSREAAQKARELGFNGELPAGR
jgi:Tfp pilus assembly protein PilF